MKPQPLSRLQHLLIIPGPEASPRMRVNVLLNIGFLFTALVILLCLLIPTINLIQTGTSGLFGAGLPGAALGVGIGLLLYRIRREMNETLEESMDVSMTLARMAKSTALSHEYLNNVLMSMAGSLLVIGTDASIKMVNQATLDLTGFTEAELIGKPIETLFDSDTFSSARDILSKRGFVRHGERIYKTKDGKGVTVSFSSAIMRDQHKRVFGIVCVAQDISALKELEGELNNRLTQMEILHQVDEELTHTLSINYVLTMGLDMTMRLSGSAAGAIALISAGQLNPVLAIGYPVAISKNGCIRNGITERVVRQQRAEMVLEVRSDPDYVVVMNATNALIAIPLVSQDNLLGVLQLETSRPDNFTGETFRFLQLITARIAVAIDNAGLYDTSRRQLDELKYLYTQVSNLEQMKTDMIRVAAHDLRNPLTNLALSTSILRRTLDPQIVGQYKDRLDDINRSIERMQNITTNILSLERINNAATGEFTGLVNLQTAIIQAFDDHQAQAKDKKQTYTASLPEAPLFVQGDSFELHEAVANFISNAIKYTPEGGEVTVTLRQNGGSAIFEVTDTGFGIPEDQQTRLFEPFYRVHMEETQNIEGTGLGLHLVRQIIERHKGSIRFQSKKGEGSVFGFNLPLPDSATRSTGKVPTEPRKNPAFTATTSTGQHSTVSK
ncbi:MAG TPA: PAS domain-containing sensor histidine kinase [Phototrophicaceae bacterium]|nr:PAS domain-containing sensor histidine kinase [Phototrophicaceae bacterium]